MTGKIKSEQHLKEVNDYKDVKKGEVEEKQAITSDDVREAEEIRRMYRRSRTNFDKRIIENEKYWKLLHNEIETQLDSTKNPEARKHKVPKVNTSAWLLNSVNNTHADFMDNYPEPNILPREKSDKDTAAALNKIVPTIMKYNHYEKTYNLTSYDKTKSGTSATGIFWDNDLNDGMGDISIKEIDILTIDWQPKIQNIQDSKNLFITVMKDLDEIKEIYDIDIKATGRDGYIPSYEQEDYIDENSMVAVTDWYYKKKIKFKDNQGLPRIKTILHYVKYCDGNVLYASENDPKYKDRGWYDHGDYPVVFDVYYPEKDSPVGFGKIDIMKNPQQFIDNMSDELLVNVKWNARPRWLGKRGSGINNDDFLDLDKTIVEVEGSIDENHLRQIDTRPIDANIFNLMNYKVEELKETSGNRDFSQGSTASGVTSGSAIAALMEAGSKLSRDALKNTYAAHNEICYMVIELMRQFYTESRVFRITGEAEAGEKYEFVKFSNEALQPQIEEIDGVLFEGRKPIFDIECVSQKASPFSKLSQNELAKELYQLGFFNPELADQSAAALEMMEFEGKEMVLNRISKNGTMFNQIQQLQMQVVQLSQQLALIQGASLQQQQNEVVKKAPQGDVSSKMGNLNSLGAESASSTALNNTREKVRSQTEVQ